MDSKVYTILHHSFLFWRTTVRSYVFHVFRDGDVLFKYKSPENGYVCYCTMIQKYDSKKD
jgi:hypothetical protein